MLGLHETVPRIISFELALLCPAWPGLVSTPHLASPRLASPRLASPHLYLSSECAAPFAPVPSHTRWNKLVLKIQKDMQKKIRKGK